MTTIPRRRIRAVATGLAAALALVLATAAPAGATPTLTPSGTYQDLDVVDVSGTAPTGALSFTIAQCKVDLPTVVPGAACHLDTADGPLPVTGGTYSYPDLTLREGWTPNYSFLTGTPTNVGGSTLCDGVGSDDCYVAVSFYGTTGHISTDLAPLTFT